MHHRLSLLAIAASFAALCLLGASAATAGDCAGDANADGRVDFMDVLFVVSDYGCEGDACDGDLTGDGMTDFNDIIAVISDFGCGFQDCESNADCDDGDPCTIDICTGFGCIHIPNGDCGG